MIKVLILLIISALPVVLIANYAYKKDKNKEPTSILTKLFLGGIGSTFLVLILTGIIAIFVPSITTFDETYINPITLLIYIFLGIALVEEISKWLMSYTISYNNKDFDEFYDMILYCVFVALGFAFFENILYILEGGISTGIIRAFTAVPGHACFGALMGYYLGLAKINQLNNRKDIQKKYIYLSIIVPTLAHGIYDYLLFASKIYPLISILLVALAIIFITIMYIYVINKIKKISSITRKMKYKDNFCINCGHIVQSNYCPQCGRKNE